MPNREASESFWARLGCLLAGLRIPRAHLVAAGLVAVAIAALLTLMPSAPDDIKRNTVAIELPPTPAADLAASPVTSASRPAMDAADAADADEPVAGAPQWREDVVRAGDNLTSVFKRLGLSDVDVYAVANGCEEAKELKKLQPGETISALVDANDDLIRVKYVRSPIESYIYEAEDAGFSGKKHVLVPAKEATFRQGRIDRSLAMDASRAGLSQEKILALANIFAWDIDFARDIKAGDRFGVLYEEHFVGDQAVGTGDILAAEFVNRGKTYRAVRYVAKDGTASYYTPDGRPMRKAFLRAPLDFMKVSSNFNMRRFHPILKMVRPHRGVDYSAPTGTPVYAAGNGVVVASSFSGPNGNYVVIQHNSTYTTKYLHLNNRLVKRGQRVKQGATIGKVGSTGYATGPHLHYEFLIRGVHQDPRSAKMPIAEPIPKTLQPQFAAQTKPLLAKLADFETVHLAAATTPSSENID